MTAEKNEVFGYELKKPNIFERFYASACRGWNYTKDLIAFQVMLYVAIGAIGLILSGLSFIFNQQ